METLVLERPTHAAKRQQSFPRMLAKPAPPIAFDLTHLEHRSRYSAPTGIERVDLSFGEHFAFSSTRDVRAVHYGFRRPVVFEKPELQHLVRTVRSHWGLDRPFSQDRAYDDVTAWLRNHKYKACAVKECNKDNEIWPNVVSAVRRRTLPYLRQGPSALPLGSIYINVAQHAFENPAYFQWLKHRQDLHCVFFVHDLLPIDFPEFWPDGHERLFASRLDCITSCATAIITSSREVKARLEKEYERRSKRPVPVLALPFVPSGNGKPDVSSSTSEDPYFVVIGTLEPRKNHMFMLNVWCDLAERMENPPKLVIAGKRAWSSDAVVDRIDRSPRLRRFVRVVHGLNDSALRDLLAKSRALLMPSVAEGFGIPVIEALGLNVPVVANDIPIFREVTRGAATLLRPFDGPAWAQTIEALAADGQQYETARNAAVNFKPPTRAEYFRDVEGFLECIGTRVS